LHDAGVEYRDHAAVALAADQPAYALAEGHEGVGQGEFCEGVAAARLDELPVIGRDFLKAQVHIEQSLAPRFPQVDADELRAAWADLMRRARLQQHHTITREQLSVREHMSIVLRALQRRPFVEFEDLFDVSRGPQVVVVTFIAMLELAREHLLQMTQAEPYAPIYLRLAYQPA
jgi:segregation and condensation protein A